MIAGDRDQRRQEVEKQPGNSQRQENYNAVIPAVASSVLAGDSETNIEFLQLSGHFEHPSAKQESCQHRNLTNRRC